MYRNWIKTIIGILLILSSIAGIFYWEYQGRDRLLTTKILVAKMEIQIGQLIERNVLEEANIPREIIISNPLKKEDLENLIGKVAKVYIPKNSQLNDAFFQDGKLSMNLDESIYVLKPEWIYMVSSAVRAGDSISIFSKDSSIFLGNFRVAFVKDSSFREVKSANQDTNKTSLLERLDATSFVSYVEITSTLQSYEKIVGYINSGIEKKLLLVIMNP
ncbi:MAG: SAF domain-containing protein [Eubacteriales bacterium]